MTGVGEAHPTMCQACAVGPILGQGSVSKAAADVYPHNAGSRTTVSHARRESQKRVRAPKRAWFRLPLRAAACRLSSSLVDSRLLAGSSHGEERGLLVSLLRRALIFPGGSAVESACQCRRCRRCGFDPWVRKIPWRRKWQPTPVFLPGKSHGQRSLADYSPWVRKELDMTECSHTHTYIHTHAHH